MTRKLTLTILWWGWGLLLFVLMIALAGNPALFGDDARAAWEWFVPNILPTLTLVGAAAYASEAPAPGDGRPPALFVLALAVSIFYLVVLSGTMAATVYSTAPIQSLRGANLYLGPLQGMATSFLTLFFVKK